MLSIKYHKSHPDAADGLLGLLFQFHYLEEVFVLELSEILEGEEAAAVATVTPSSADVLFALFVMEDEVCPPQNPALLAL